MKQSNFSLAIVILALLVSSTSFAASAADPRAPSEEFKKTLDAPPPDPKEHSKAALTKIYMERGRAASTLGDLDRELTELDAGIQAVGAKDPNAYAFLTIAACHPLGIPGRLCQCPRRARVGARGRWKRRTAILSTQLS